MKILPRNFQNLKLDLHLLKEEEDNDLDFTETFFHQDNLNLNHSQNFNNLFIYKKNFPYFDNIFQNHQNESRYKFSKNKNDYFQIQNNFSFLEFEKNMVNLFLNNMDYNFFMKIKKDQINVLKTIIFAKLDIKKLTKKNFKKYFDKFYSVNTDKNSNCTIIKYSLNAFKDYLKKKYYKFRKINYFEKYYLGEIQNKKYCNSELFKILNKKEQFCIDFGKFRKEHLNLYLKQIIKKNIKKFLLKFKNLLKRKKINQKILYKFTKKNFKLISFTLNEFIYQTKKNL